MKKNLKRSLLYILGIFLLALGINVSKAAGLGISPVSAVPYALELIWGFDLAKATILMHVVCVALQILLLRKNYKAIQLLQIVCVYFLSIFITYTSADYLLFWLPLPSAYIFKLIYLLISIILIGVGVSFYLIANLVPLPAEGLMEAIVEVSNNKFKFSNVKVAVDSTLVLISAIISLIFLRELVTVREGTILSAILVGRVVGFVFKNYKEKFILWFNNQKVLS